MHEHRDEEQQGGGKGDGPGRGGRPALHGKPRLGQREGHQREDDDPARVDGDVDAEESADPEAGPHVSPLVLLSDCSRLRRGRTAGGD